VVWLKVFPKNLHAAVLQKTDLGKPKNLLEKQ